MKAPRNKSHKEGTKMLGVYMPQELKDRVQTAAKLERRITSDWVRIVLEDTADAVIAKHAAELEKPAPAPLMMVADEPGETSCPSTPATGAPPVKYQGGRRSRKN